ncbi:MAG: hypothetical protein M1820_004524 [Bogoriella megaspora]|nr:MAG: hypothetical protein M1820_004524 [Bogoriella megaspora]
MRFAFLFSVAASVAYAYAGSNSSVHSWKLKDFKTLIAFGDSYTDDSRYGFFSANNGSAPPAGWVDPVNLDASDGGRIWVQYVAQYSGAQIYNYAVSGAVCSNDLTPRLTNGGFDYPAIEQYELPAFIADSQYVEANGTRFFDSPRDSTVYSIWIGTNDLGTNAFLTDSNLPNTTIVDYLNCIYTQFDRLYSNGARNFVIQNNAPLHLVPMYSLPNNAGQANGQNATELHYRMQEQVVLANDGFKYRTPYELLVAERYPGASFAIYDIYGLMSDIYYNPAEYLNGTAPANVTGWVDVCDASGKNCTLAESPDSYMWYNALHPSEQTDRVVAKNFVDVVRGRSKWATYWSS